MKIGIMCSYFLAVATYAVATEFHVAVDGNDSNPGTKKAPFRTIQKGADVAQPGDIITVHAGVYRERINPPRGGESDGRRIVYQAARGEKVEIKGSEIVRNWEKVEPGVWKVIIPNSFFKDYNPYADLIRGDWFNGRGREHHTGAVYLDGNWLIEAARLDDVLSPASRAPQGQARGECLLNVAWFRPEKADKDAGRVPAARFAAQEGVQKAPCVEGGECIGWIEAGDWVRYDAVDFGRNSESVEIRAASETRGGSIELRLGAPDGELLGACEIPNTRGWQSWSSFKARIKPMSGIKTLCMVFCRSKVDSLNAAFWFAKTDPANTTIWAQFKDFDPNKRLVEINARRAVFYPDKPGRNYITVRGFTMRHAATQWAPPTSEQVGLIGTHWSKGWVIEDNVISHSVCSGVALGKHGDQFDNTSANSAEGYVKTIERAHAYVIPWTKENIGHHLVRNNTISHCEQTGIVGSLGCAFSTVTGNKIHDIHVRGLFTGAEMAGIKFHAAIDVEISNNHIYRTCRGLWLDWMAQGTRVTKNLFHDNSGQDLFVEVDHGPFMVDNNIFLSAVNLLDMSEGGAYVHNLMTGRIVSTEEPGRQTPYHPAHSTTLAGLSNVKGGDNRFYNNIFVGGGPERAKATKATDRHRSMSGYGLWVYDEREFPLYTGGNVYLNGARPYDKERECFARPELNPEVKLVEEDGNMYLQAKLDGEMLKSRTVLVTTELLGKAKIPGMPYENADGSPFKINTDYLGKKRSKNSLMPGPFERAGKRLLNVKVR